jgi:hypothetical protein
VATAPPPRENYIYDFRNVIINYSLDIWDFLAYRPYCLPGEKIPRTGKQPRDVISPVKGSRVRHTLNMSQTQL